MVLVDFCGGHQEGSPGEARTEGAEVISMHVCACVHSGSACTVFVDIQA